MQTEVHLLCLFYKWYDRAFYVLNRSSEASKKLRWWASLCLLLALVPVVCLYLVWYPLTCAEYVKAADIEQNKHVQNKLCSCITSRGDVAEKSSENSVVSSETNNIL